MNHGHLSLECTRNFNRSCDVTCLRGAPAIESIINADNRENFNSAMMFLCNPRSLQMSLGLRIKSYNIVQTINHNSGVAMDGGHFSRGSPQCNVCRMLSAGIGITVAQTRRQVTDGRPVGRDILDIYAEN